MKSLLSTLFIITFLAACGSGSTNEGSGVTGDQPASDSSSEPRADSNNDSDVGSNSNPDDSAGSGSAGQDPLTQNTIQVTFDITVPVYQSNELKVEVIWGEMILAAAWVGDEYWSATAELPTEQQHVLTVTFYDKNGELELARYSQNFKTGSNASESMQISADDFDASQFDDDGDGTSNFDELVAGSDPLVDESTLLEVRDYVALAGIVSYSQSMEAQLTDDRPYSLSNSEFVPFTDEEDSLGTSYRTDIDIDAEGNGTYSYSSYQVFFTESRSGIRTNSGTSISWEGSYSSYDGDYGRSAEYSNRVTKTDENTRNFVENISEVYSGTYRDTLEVSSALTGKIIEGTSVCKPVSGTVIRKSGTNRNSDINIKSITTTVSKQADDQYWKVVTVNGANETTAYLARELEVRVLPRPEGGKPATFICDFVDF